MLGFDPGASSARIVGLAVLAATRENATKYGNL